VVPIVFFTQLLGVALGIDYRTLGFGKELVGAEAVIRANLQSQPAGATA
jgi:heterodisulfide reductase subunit B